MKKKLLAIALLYGTASLTHATSSVTLIGVIDTGVGYQSFKNKDNGIKASYSGLFNGVWSSNSWGLKATEDLGDGLSAIFKLESGFSSLTGQSSSDRLLKTTILGLASKDWGSVKFGRMGNAVQNYASYTAGPSDEENLSDITNTFSAAGSNKADNTIVYHSPNFNGLDFAIGYSFNTNGPQSSDNRNNTKLITAATGYSSGPLTLALGYDRLQSAGWEKKVHSWIAVGGYTWDSVLIGVAVGQDINGRQNGFGSYVDSPAFTNWNSGYTKDFKTTSVTLNATVPVNAVSSAMVGWSMSRASSSFTNAYSLARRQQNIYSAGYTYSLSKRTSLYAIGAYATGFAFQNVRGQQMIVGLDHSF
ncbi:porin [Alcaligenes endophyticus]|uniref:Porin n=1 Tax=Alcaligenes endophyticus TaxID=1929088 RepID=A0ABT8EJS0_9BURK|nr:porin [Alcaligenes endophyticus]MCX5591854.1 porin [Alcaligenes endophyticus]MDN4121544.1 porin [Alcaligenes endophyticus]